jgi:hypothetical protein
MYNVTKGTLGMESFCERLNVINYSQQLSIQNYIFLKFL